jgi:hypothetical protein
VGGLQVNDKGGKSTLVFCGRNLFRAISSLICPLICPMMIDRQIPTMSEFGGGVVWLGWCSFKFRNWEIAHSSW